LNKGKFRSFGLILVFLLVFGFMFYFASKGDSGELLTSTQIEDIVFNGNYIEETIDRDGNTIHTKIETGYVTDMYASGGVCYIKVQKSDLGNKSFPKYSDYYFTYARTNSQALEYFYTFNKMIDAANAGQLYYNDNGVNRSLAGYDQLQKISIIEIVPQENFFEAYLPYIIMLIVLLISGFVLMDSKS